MKKYIPFTLIAGLLVLTLFIFSQAFAGEKNNTILTVAFLDIGQGDSIYIEAPNGRQMIIDGGRDSSIMRELGPLMPWGDASIDILMVTNPDLDHYAGFLDVLKQFHVGAVIEPGTHSSTKTYASLERSIAEKKVPELLARKGMQIMLDREHDVEFDVLFPDRDVSTWNSNDGSIEGVLIYGKTKIMFTGDGTQKTEGIVLANNAPDVVKSDILKVGHHGSRTSSADAFVAAVAPEYAVISDGKNNSYGHPHQETLDTLARHNVQVLRTDQLGTIVFESDGNSFSCMAGCK